jgi:hypothetical protein
MCSLFSRCFLNLIHGRRSLPSGRPAAGPPSRPRASRASESPRLRDATGTVTVSSRVGPRVRPGGLFRVCLAASGPSFRVDPPAGSGTPTLRSGHVTLSRSFRAAGRNALTLRVHWRNAMMGRPADGPGAGCQLQTGNDKSSVSDRILRADKAQGSDENEKFWRPGSVQCSRFRPTR